MHRASFAPANYSVALGALLAATLGGLCSACGDDSSSAVSPRPLSSDGTHLRDDRGRIALLRGINARINGIFDVSFSDGRVALEPIPELTDEDCQRMRQLGLDFLRLPINWSGYEPTQGAYSDEYLARVDAAVQCAARAGMLVMIDLHQDAYSKEIGEDGAPLWAISPAPTELLQGPLTDLGERRLSAQTTAAFNTFFDPADPAGVRHARLVDAALDLRAERVVQSRLQRADATGDARCSDGPGRGRVRRHARRELSRR